MRTDTVQYAQASRAPSRRPRYVIRIIFDTASPSITSHDDITSVPGDVLEGLLQSPSAISQRLIPDEGRTEIGSFSFSLIDKNSAFTNKIRAKLVDDGEGIRGKKVVFYDGYQGFDFTAFQIFQTQVVQYTSYQNGAYQVQCADITREQRQSILEPVSTTLRDSVSDTDTTVPVYVTTDFETVVHGTSWSDAPSSTVGYIKIQDEIIRYTGKTSDSFTGCTRGVLNTKAVAHEVDAGTSAERRTKVEEYIYLELPAVKLAWAILTGELVVNLVPNSSFEIDSNSDGVPDSWTNTSFGSNITIVTSLVTTPVVRGTRAMKMQVTAITSPSSLRIHSRVTPITPAVVVTEGRSYSISCAVLTSTTTYQARIGIDWLDSGGATLSQVFMDHAFAATGKYDRLVTPDYTAPTGAVGARFRLGIVRPSTSNTTLGYLIFDDCVCIGPSGATIPGHWNLGIDSSYIRKSDFIGIGIDLWDPSDDSAALPLRFEGLGKTDGKAFLEKEIYLVLGCYSPVYSDGTLGLRRLPALLSDASPVAILTEREVISTSELTHDDAGMHNIFRVNWNWDPQKNEFTRITYFSDDDSISIHGRADLKEYSFKGLHGSRHTDATVRDRLHSLRDAYAHPPERITVTVHGSLSYLEIGDVVQLRMQSIRDYAGNSASIDRAFAIFQKTHASARNTIDLELFGSTARPLPTGDPESTDASLPDAWYTSEGASLSTIATITANVMATGSYSITGSADLTNSGAIYYWDDDLTIPNGCDLTIADNVQLRIRGFLTLNGTINGVGAGHPGVVDAGGSPWDTTYAGNPGYVGSSRGWDGLHLTGALKQVGARSIPAVLTRGSYDAFPFLNLSVSGSVLVGLPTDLRGTGGAPGGRLVDASNGIDSVGGTGAAGGGGLAIICRGMTPGVSALIDLSGDDSASTTAHTYVNKDVYPGSGGAGGPGALLILLDGSTISIPDITNKFIGATGAVNQLGNPLDAREVPNAIVGAGQLFYPAPLAAYQDPGVISGIDLSNSAHRIQYIPRPATPTEDQLDKPAAPTQLAAGPGNGGNILTWFNPDPDTFDLIEIWASLDNDRTNAVRVGNTRSDFFTHRLPLGGLYYYWIRAKVTPEAGRTTIYSDWERSSPTDGESSNIETPGEVPEAPFHFTAVGKLNGILFNWSLPWGKLSGIIRLYEAAHGDPISSATLVWEGYDLSVFLTKSDTTTRDYWVLLAKGGAESLPEPNGSGLAAAASSVTSALTASASSSSITKSATISQLLSGATVTTPPVTVTASGGMGPYSYSWAFYSGGSGLTIDSPSSATTTHSGGSGANGEVRSGVSRCTVTDSASATAFVDVNVQINWPDIS